MRHHLLSSHPIAVARRTTRARMAGEHGMARGDESGFTLIELIVVVAILPIIVGAMTAALLSIITVNRASRIGCRIRGTHRS